jgi:D-citramalate synthase
VARRIAILDTTLRDGEQMQDVGYNPEEKLAIARTLLAEVKVNHLELSSALVSSGERDAVELVVAWAAENRLLQAIEVLGFTDGDRSVNWIAELGGKVMNILAKGSRKHVEGQLRKTPARHFDDIAATVAAAEVLDISCNIYLEDWSGGVLDEPSYVVDMLEMLARLPMRRIMLPDTRGLLAPHQVSRFVGEAVARYPEAAFDFHAHDDYGLATANSLAAVEAGATCIHCTINGMGERAGNAPLEEVVVGIHDVLGRKTTIDEKKLIQASRQVDVFSGRRVASNKPIVGSNVFTQTAGIHADGDNKGDLYSSPLSPERFNRKRRYALGKLSGRSSLEFNLNDLGIHLSSDQHGRVLARIKELADRKATITQEDLPFIISDVLETPSDRAFQLLSCVVVSSVGLKSVATVKLGHRADGAAAVQELESSAQGDGGYDAFMNAVKEIANRVEVSLPALTDYRVSIPGGGQTDALVQCTITWAHPTQAGGVFSTKGVNSDQVLAAAEATEKMLNLLSTLSGLQVGRLAAADVKKRTRRLA